LGEFVTAFTNSAFSRKQENEADDYAFKFCIENDVDPYAMAKALEKLVKLSNGEKSNAIQKMLASHPDSKDRAARMRAKAEEYVNN